MILCGDNIYVSHHMDIYVQVYLYTYIYEYNVYSKKLYYNAKKIHNIKNAAHAKYCLSNSIHIESHFIWKMYIFATVEGMLYRVVVTTAIVVWYRIININLMWGLNHQ